MAENSFKGICPFGKEKHEDCSFFRRGIRIVNTLQGEEHVPFEECAINIIADCLENLVGRNISLQQEMNLVRGEAEKTNLLFNAILSHQQQIARGSNGY
jgi:hypothetical protein